MALNDRALARLDGELIAWLTTVAPDGQPQTSPVWFHWDGNEFLVYSLTGTPRTRNIASNPRVSVNLDGNGLGGDIVTIEGEARLDPTAPSAAESPEYVAKYAARMDQYGWTPDWFAGRYSEAIRIRPTRSRSW